VRHSIIRRSVGVTAAFVAGHALNYALMWGANHLLDSGGFGLFYTSLLIVNVLLSPIIAGMLVLVRRLADAGARHGHSQVVAMTWQVLGGCLRALPIVVLVGLLLAAGVGWLGLEAWPIAFLIPLTVLAVVAAEVLRTAYQGMLLFRWQNAIWIASVGAQFAFAIGAMWLLPRVWMGIGGVMLGSAATFGAFLPWFVRAEKRAPPCDSTELTLDLSKELPMIIGYSLFILLNNIDILIGYWLLPRADLDVYAASSLLPKAITTATFAVAQVLLPVITEQRADGHSSRQSIIKALAMATGVGAVGAAALWIAVPWLQATPLAIHGLDVPTMITLAVAAVALSAIRVLVIVEIALRRYAVGVAQGGAILLFAVLCGTHAAPVLRIAEIYAAVTCGFLAIVALAVVPRPLISGFFQSPVR
jgi:hypothetical protein